MSDINSVAMTLRDLWRKQGVARVVHPKHGEIVVPCGSKLAALMCASAVWKVNWMAIRDAEIWAAEPGEKPVPMPQKYKRIVDRYEKQMERLRTQEEQQKQGGKAP